MKPPVQYVNVWNWDVLIVLDSCRYDFFKEINSFDGQLLKLEITASSTIEWLKQNFPFRYPYVYISGNPFCNSSLRVYGFLGSEHFKRVIDVWKFGWDEKLKTVRPQIVTASAIPYVASERVIIHYMQPHFPSIGKIRLPVGAWKPNPPDTYVEGLTHNYKEISNNLLKQAYAENLGIVLEEVERLLSRIPVQRKVVVTSDHGELLGENGMYEHPSEMRHPLLNTVPWLEVKR